MKRTNSLSYQSKFYPLLLDWITSEDHDLNTPREKLNYFYNYFQAVTNHPYELAHRPNEQERLNFWLQGLPISIPFAYTDIIKVAEETHECKLTEKQKDRIIENFFNFCAYHYLRMINMTDKQLNRILTHKL